jgi:site-specific DNA-methyltransferase (adenine-specific)
MSTDTSARIFKLHALQLDRFHPTQKPVKLYSWLLREYAEPGWRILDTHMGSGSSVIAALDAGFEMLACEIDPEYFATAVERIGRELQQGTFAMTPNDLGSAAGDQDRPIAN